MRVATFQALRQQFGFQCGYCGISETDAGTTLTTDHFQPRSQGGTDALSNLVYACHACNEHKGDWWNPDGPNRLLHPINDDIDSHLFEDPENLLQSHTITGAFHIQRMQLNRPALIAYRQRLQAREVERRERAEILRMLHQMAQDIASLEEAINHLRSGGE